jgi:hypothetical protein
MCSCKTLKINFINIPEEQNMFTTEEVLLIFRTIPIMAHYKSPPETFLWDQGPTGYGECAINKWKKIRLKTKPTLRYGRKNDHS